MYRSPAGWTALSSSRPWMKAPVGCRIGLISSIGRRTVALAGLESRAELHLPRPETRCAHRIATSRRFLRSGGTWVGASRAWDRGESFTTHTQERESTPEIPETFTTPVQPTTDQRGRRQ